MMGCQPDFQPKLFYHSVNLDKRIPAHSILRKIRGHIDFDFIYREVKDCYDGKVMIALLLGYNGYLRYPPPTAG